MLDSTLRPLINPPLAATARVIARAGISANAMSLLGAAAGVASGVAIAMGRYGLALALIALSRIFDGIDGAIARIDGPTPFGGYLDSICDYAFYAAVPLGFAFGSTSHQLPAAVLLASFLLSGASFLAFGAVAASRGLRTDSQGAKSFYYLAGLAEGTETIAVFVIVTLRPQWFPPLAYGFAALCIVTAAFRLLRARALLRAAP